MTAAAILLMVSLVSARAQDAMSLQELVRLELARQVPPASIQLLFLQQDFTLTSPRSLELALVSAVRSCGYGS